jgi:hypothetical protein
MPDLAFIHPEKHEKNNVETLKDVKLPDKTNS